ncbi:iron chaperone [Nocardia sp. NPDC101769]|uniref:iron chaperone n=1 Tax=Nocardia sp. NPDC101769 TaxID=3364333 RepID=UPI00380720AD
MATQTTTKKTTVGFSAEERAAMKAHAAELKTAARRGSRSAKADGEQDVLAKIAEMTGSDREIAERLHALIKSVAPELTCKTWYGMPSYMRDGKIVCFFQTAAKFKTRYATLGFNDIANLDDGDLWPVNYALKTMTPAVEARVTELVKKALS